MNENKTMNLAQSLAIDSQLRLPGSAGRLLKQIRDIEQVAPLFRDAGLVKAVPKPTVVNLRVAGIASKSCLDKALGGFIYASAAVRTDLLIEDNKVSTVGSDSVSELDDIDFEAQRKRLDLIEIRQAYLLLEKQLLSQEPCDLILLDTPLFLAREMIPLDRNAKHVEEFNKTKQVIEDFWDKYRASLFPWNNEGPVLAGILAERFSAIVSIARQDLRTEEGRKHLLISDGFNESNCRDELGSLEESLSGVGDTRFINGILGNYSRTIAFRMTENRARMEPAKQAELGIVGFHFRSARGGQIKMVQLAGDEPEWQSADFDLVASRLMVLDMQSKGNAMPLPQLLGYQQLGILPKFARFYRQGLHGALKNNDIEAGWLAGLDEGINNGI
ncbi:hypothetical protein [Rheinheimera tangshanensis]|uniref:NurA domain-containing protein n=1 Tax=Rheinheimera tangshanensis TaxID=400153 RepID=A0A5C8M697_9GAMM|nr:hypothetical protein [Rheinheimera tangshanensis]TXK83292.1 hypothetical protein FU839_03190 [Rheinheimera tangshanensis]GGM44767.1 hypothetical protein GCM10010920_01290 [Rheinheimera tangshanensis]